MRAAAGGLGLAGAAAAAAAAAGGLGAEDARALPRTLVRCARLAHCWGQVAWAYAAHGPAGGPRGAAAGAAPEAAEAAARRLSVLHYRCARKLLRLARANGGIYVKFGQIASQQPQVPEEYRLVLGALQDAARPRSFRQVRRTLERDLGRPLGEAFEAFERAPAAVASLAQVHRARLPGGGEVAVKVQHAGIEAQINADLVAFRLAGALARRLFPGFDQAFGWLLPELEASLERETDFRGEQRNAARLAELTRLPRVRVPRMHPQLSTRRVVTMEWVEGWKVTDRGALERAGVAPQAVARAMTELFAEMIFGHGFLHADAHPGNFLVARPEEGRAGGAGAEGAPGGAGGGGGGASGAPSALGALLRAWSPWGGGGRRGRGGAGDFDIVVLDHGLYIEMDPGLQAKYRRLWVALAQGDQRAAAEISRVVAGDRAADILPVLLSPQQLGRPPLASDVQNRLRADCGVGSPGQLSEFLASLPLELVQAYRSQAFTKGLALRSGWGNSAWLRVTAHWARAGGERGGRQALHRRLSMETGLLRLQAQLAAAQAAGELEYFLEGLLLWALGLLGLSGGGASP